MQKSSGRADLSGTGFMIADRRAGGIRVQRNAHDRAAIERQLRRAMRADRGSVALRHLLGQTHFRPANIHLMTDEEVVRVLTRLVSVGEIHVRPARWHVHASGARETAAETSGTAQASTTATATGGKAVKSSSDVRAERRDRGMRPDDNTADRPMPPSSKPPEPKNWIEFHLVDDETEEPIANVPFKISMPDGSVAEHTSDGNGMIRIADLEPGYCDIREIQDRAAFEVVGIV